MVQYDMESNLQRATSYRRGALASSHVVSCCAVLLLAIKNFKILDLFSSLFSSSFLFYFIFSNSLFETRILSHESDPKENANKNNTNNNNNSVVFESCFACIATRALLDLSPFTSSLLYPQIVQ